MKKGIFNSPPLLLLVAAFICLPGCATFLQFAEHGDDPAEYDRGYEAEAEDDTDDTETVSRRSELRGDDEDMDYSQRRVKRAISTRDVVLGMTRKEVAESWGSPAQREVAGKGGGGHERWTYGSRFSLSGSRTVIFENGRVAGWSQ